MKNPMKEQKKYCITVQYLPTNVRATITLSVTIKGKISVAVLPDNNNRRITDHFSSSGFIDQAQCSVIKQIDISLI